MAQFSRELLKILKKRGITTNYFAVTLLGYKNSGLVTLVLQGERSAPLDEIDQWLKVLELDEHEAKRMKRMALEDYAPDYVLKLINQQRHENQAWMKLVYRKMKEKGISLPPPPDLYGDEDPAPLGQPDDRVRRPAR